MFSLDLEGIDTPVGGDALCLVEFDEFALLSVLSGSVEVVEAEGDFEGAIFGDGDVGIVVVFGIPGDFGMRVSMSPMIYFSWLCCQSQSHHRRSSFGRMKNPP
jgi:hypothetical protein